MIGVTLGYLLLKENVWGKGIKYLLSSSGSSHRTEYPYWIKRSLSTRTIYLRGSPLESIKQHHPETSCAALAADLHTNLHLCYSENREDMKLYITFQYLLCQYWFFVLSIKDSIPVKIQQLPLPVDLKWPEKTNKPLYKTGQIQVRWLKCTIIQVYVLLNLYKY